MQFQGGATTTYAMFGSLTSTTSPPTTMPNTNSMFANNALENPYFLPQPTTVAVENKTNLPPGFAEDTSGEAPILECFSCKRKSRELLKCGRCHKVFFCNVECQRNGWTAHKAECNKSIWALWTVQQQMS
mmetsp:Transcript_21700/g.32196  ORF Transcript_21700/g.32196 Transcript_21700/m.32196 type:complete len:130 (+) Transcript_21700:2-391(+)